MIVEGTVTTVGKGSKFKVLVDGMKKDVTAVLSGRLKHKKIEIEVGDRVKMRPADKFLFVIIYRYK